MKRSMHWFGVVMSLSVNSGCGNVNDGRSNSADALSSTGAALDLEASYDGRECSGGAEDPQNRPLGMECVDLLTALHFPNTTFTSATEIAEGELVQPGQVLPAHCLLVGKMNERISPVDGQTYSIGFEMRLPLLWNRRFFYQGNGGLDGSIIPATGATVGGGPLTSALLKGFAVISSDAGHNAAQGPLFGLDPQARLDFGYQAVGTLTPMAKTVLKDAYGKRPAYSYIGGCSNGGRHAMVAAARYPDEYDGYLVGAPGFHLPDAAIASISGAQQYLPLTTGGVIPGGPFAGLPDLSEAFTPLERQLLREKVLAECDGLDGVVDGMVLDSTDCQAVFDLDEHVPTCVGPRDGTCLSASQKVAIGKIHSGATTSGGVPFYSSFPYDTGYAGADAAFWDFISPLILDSGAVGFVFSVPPADPFTFIPPLFALSGSVDQMVASVASADGTYTESAQSFMVPPDLTLRGLGRKSRMIVYHGVSDPIFSADDTRQWYEGLERRRAKRSARLYLVPGMSHCSNGPATDQFDMLTPLMRWVEKGVAPKEIVASVRGPANPGGPNFELPPDWSPDRTRPLCPFPRTAIYKGGDVESADSFKCR